ncbi:MAG: DUF3383 family protein [Methylomicrobium sp.]|nr:DUF3383 family protein [Methylomicrobium sp.]
MISLIRDRVKVDILRDTSAISRVSFGVPLFIGETDKSIRVNNYANIDEVSAVYDDTDPEHRAAVAFFAQAPQPRQMVIGFKDVGESYTEALTAIREIDDTFFAVSIQSRLDADALLLAPAVSSLPGLRQFWFVSDDANMLNNQDETSIAFQLRELNFDQVRVIYHSDGADTFPDMAILGRVLPITESATTGPGSTAWHDQPIVGITGENFTTSERAALEGFNVEYFINIAGATRTMGGKMAGGEWGDVMHFIAWLATRISEDVYQLMARVADRREKIPFSDAGIARIEATLRARLDIGVAIGGILNDYTVSVPLREETLFDDRVNRTLKSVRFEANLAGAIKFTEILGIVSA